MLRLFTQKKTYRWRETRLRRVLSAGAGGSRPILSANVGKKRVPSSGIRDNHSGSGSSSSSSSSSNCLNIIVAVAENGVIGKDGDLPWKHLAEDKAHLHRCIRGNVVVHGSKIYEELGGKVLPHCTTIVLSRDDRKRFDGVGATARSLSGALRKASSLAALRGASVWILGGAEIYREALPLADVLWYTAVRSRPRGDVFFPHWWRTYFSTKPGAIVAECDPVPSEDRPGYAIYKYERQRGRSR
eukprot:g5558.t1